MRGKCYVKSSSLNDLQRYSTDLAPKCLTTIEASDRHSPRFMVATSIFILLHLSCRRAGLGS